MFFIQNQLTTCRLFLFSFVFLLFEQIGNEYTWTFVASWSPSALPPPPPRSSFPSTPPLRTYSRTNKVVTVPLEPSALVSAGAAALSAGLSDNVHISLLPEEPIGSHFAFALETHTHTHNQWACQWRWIRGGREGGGRSVAFHERVTLVMTEAPLTLQPSSHSNQPHQSVKYHWNHNKLRPDFSYKAELSNDYYFSIKTIQKQDNLTFI